MDKRISIFIFSCFLLTWIASALGSDPMDPGAVPPNTSALGSDPEEPGAEPPNKEASKSDGSGSTKSPTTASALGSDPEELGAVPPNKETLSSGESGSTKSPTTTPGTSLSTAGSSSSPTSATDGAKSGSSSSDKLLSTTIASSPASKISTESQTDTTITQELGTASPIKNTTIQQPKDSSTTSPPTVPKLTATATKNHTGSGESHHEEEKSKETSDKKFLWILLPAVCGLLAAITYWKFKCKKVQHRPEMTDNGTENASFQRTDSNKDGVMLLGVSKTPSGAENVI